MLLLQEPKWNKSYSVTFGAQYGTEAEKFHVK